jgi:hypothetical protein
VSRHHPVLQLHEFRLQAEKLAEIFAAVLAGDVVVVCGSTIRKRMMILELHLKFLIVTVGQIAADAAHELFRVQ